MIGDTDKLIEAVALAILNSDRAMAGLPPVASRDSIPDSEGYVVNARAVIPLVLEEAAKEDKEQSR